MPTLLYLSPSRTGTWGSFPPSSPYPVISSHPGGVNSPARLAPPSRYGKGTAKQYAVSAVVAAVVTFGVLSFGHCEEVVALDGPCGVDGHAASRNARDSAATTVARGAKGLQAQSLCCDLPQIGRANREHNPIDREAGIKPGHGPSKLTTPLALYSLSIGSDLAATAWAESNGAVEANPIHRNKTARYAISAATVAGLTAVDVSLQKKGKKGTARVLRVLVFAVRGYATFHNVRNARRGR